MGVILKVVVKDKFYLTLHPRPAYVIGSGSYEGRMNLMAASWVMPVSEEPPRVCLALDKESYTWELIRETEEFTVNVLSEEYTDKIYYVGSRSGRDVDKVKSSGFKMVKGKVVSAPIVEDSIAVLECKLYKTIDCGDTVLVIGDVIRCEVDVKKYNPKYGWNLREVSIPLHLWGRSFTYPCRIKIVKT